MRHNVSIEGFAFRLRPVSDADAKLVLSLRNNPERNAYIHTTSENIEDQLKWLEAYYNRQDDYYFVIERIDSNIAEGVISLYDIDSMGACGEWGRWILKPESLAAVESAWLIYRCAFEKLKLRHVFCRTVADNRQVVAFHDSCGITKRSLLSDYFKIGGGVVDAVEHQIDLHLWSKINAKLEKLAQLTARRLRRG